MSPPVSGPSEGLNAAVAAELRAEMARQRVSVQMLSESADVPYGSLRRYLAAERHIDVSTLSQLAEALEISVASIVEAASARLQRIEAADQVLDEVDDELSKRRSDTGFPAAMIAAEIDTDEPATQVRKAARKPPRPPSKAVRPE